MNKTIRVSLFAVLSVVMVYGMMTFSGCGSSSSSNNNTPATAAKVQRTFVSAFRGSDANYVFIHGVNSPDGSELLVAVNETQSGAPIGSVTFYRLKMSDIINGTVTPASIIKQNTIAGMANAGGTIAFRSNYTPDGTKIVVASSDRVLVLKTSDLTPLNGATGDTNIGSGKTGVENHDAYVTSDGKYAVLMLRWKANSTDQGQTSGLALYDLTTYHQVGAQLDVCGACHASTTTGHLSCGVDGKLTLASGKYTGTLYMGNQGGGHVAVAPVSIDPTVTAAPITATSSPTKMQLSGAPGAAPDAIFHDVRYDGAANKLYWSAIVPQSSPTGTVGYGPNTVLGYVDLSVSPFTTATAVHNAQISTDMGDAAASDWVVGLPLVYCASAQTSTMYIPMTMSYPAYIDAIKKSDIVSGAVLGVSDIKVTE